MGFVHRKTKRTGVTMDLVIPVIHGLDLRVKVNTRGDFPPVIPGPTIRNWAEWAWRLNLMVVTKVNKDWLL